MSPEDPNLFIKQGVLLLLYADDLQLAYNNETAGNEVKNLSKSRYKMTDPSATERFLGMQIEHLDHGSLFFRQDTYICC